VNEATVKRYKSDLADEIEPVIAELIERAQQGLSALEKKEHSLQSKVIFISHTSIRTFILSPYLRLLNRGLEMLLELVLPTNMKLAVFRV
jgi:hypothetical protein